MNKIQHGTHGGYTNNGCRCELCKAAHASAARAYRARKKLEKRVAELEQQLAIQRIKTTESDYDLE